MTSIAMKACGAALAVMMMGMTPVIAEETNIPFTVVSLSHVSPPDVQTVAMPFISGAAKLVPVPRLNALLVQASPEDRQTLDAIVKLLDRPSQPSFITQVVKLRYADAAETAALLRNVGMANGIVAADKRSNQIVMCMAQHDAQRLNAIIEALDVESPPGAAKQTRKHKR